MIKKIKFTTLLIFVMLLILTANAEYAGAQSSSDNYIFGDVVNLRSEPSISAESIARLKIGTKIEIISKTEVIYTQNKLSYNWFKIKADIDGKEVSGYIWGGLIAREAIVDDFDGDQSDEILLLGITSGSDYSTKTAELRLVKNGKIRSSVKLELIDNYEFESYAGMKKIKRDLSFSIRAEVLSDKINSFSFVRIDVEAPMYGYFPNYFYLFATDGSSIFQIASDDSECGESSAKKIEVKIRDPYVFIRTFKYLIYDGEGPGETDSQTEVKEDKTLKYKYNGRRFVAQ